VDRGTIDLHPTGPQQRGGWLGSAFLLRDAKPKAGEKSWAQSLQEGDRGAADYPVRSGQERRRWSRPEDGLGRRDMAAFDQHHRDPVTWIQGKTCHLL
jgi:hypothetical protein